MLRLQPFEASWLVELQMGNMQICRGKAVTQNSLEKLTSSKESFGNAPKAVTG
ncbi:hypothetical protein N182_32855 [Sinorhizobium sp. GL2]|nr:hypothetical protein N182_32855 [Sinorhizobium sp. GL2]